MKNTDDRTIPSIKRRFLFYLNSQNIDLKAFCIQTGITISNFSSTGLKSELGGKSMIKILKSCPSLNANWLIVGKGEMLTANLPDSPLPAKVQTFKVNPDDKAALKELQKDYNMLKKKYFNCLEEKGRLQIEINKLIKIYNEVSP